MGKKTTFAAWVSTFVFCMGFWMLLTWSVAPVELIMGAVISAIVSAFSARFFIHSNPFWLWNPVRWVMLVVYGVCVFLVELVKANVNMARIVLNPHAHYEPGIIRVPEESVKSTYGLAMVADSITLTPGTITMDVAEDQDGKNYYYIHWINVTQTDREKAGQIIKGRMERWIGRIWK